MPPVIPKDAQEAEKLGYPLATREEIEARRARDMQTFREKRDTSDFDATGLADCTKPGTEGKRCHVTNCIDGFIFVYVCEAGVCMNKAYKIACP
ncbi:hypothetical protein [Bradyrhizobium sp. SZCCHNRI2007]|uniref:hypothetical protein n=1 Tax=Bradyrhizobium sp. SZCCHNRI2007 TaxID=3057281 RepID=UPI0028EAE921|nr:hypothetical protein [Bradyrhizobium sp. SZCCHNRI2007]